MVHRDRPVLGKALPHVTGGSSFQCFDRCESDAVFVDRDDVTVVYAPHLEPELLASIGLRGDRERSGG